MVDGEQEGIEVTLSLDASAEVIHPPERFFEPPGLGDDRIGRGQVNELPMLRSYS